MIKHLMDRLKGTVPKGKKRSSKWRKVRNDFLKKNPKCAVCETTKKLEVHHIYPFYLFPELELEEDNLITLCDGGGRGGMKSCHRFYGHLSDWKKMNLTVRDDVAYWNAKLKRY